MKLDSGDMVADIGAASSSISEVQHVAAHSIRRELLEAFDGTGCHLCVDCCGCFCPRKFFFNPIQILKECMLTSLDGSFLLPVHEFLVISLGRRSTF